MGDQIMFKTRVTEKLGIRYPIVVGTMMHISNPVFVAAASETGCLGVLASAMYKSKEELRNAIQQVNLLTEKPFAVNLNLFPSRVPLDIIAYLQLLIDEGVRIFETSGFRIPEQLVPLLTRADVTWIHKCVGLRYARKAASLGADMVTVVGYENGGATGILDIGTFVLIPTVARSLEIPVIGGGGVTNGRGLVAALALGAAAVIIGTAFLVAEECPIHIDLKKALLKARETDTELILRTLGNTHRVWKNRKADEIMQLEINGAPSETVIDAASGENDLIMFQKGDLAKGTISCGQGIGMVNEIKPIKNIVDDIISEAEMVIRGFKY